MITIGCCILTLALRKKVKDYAVAAFFNIASKCLPH